MSASVTVIQSQVYSCVSSTWRMVLVNDIQTFDVAVAVYLLEAHVTVILTY